MPQPNPVFDKGDRVPTPKEGNPNLPPELQGKSAEEVAAYYQQEQQRRDELHRQELARAAQPPAPKPPPKPGPSSADFWTDPSKATEDLIASKGLITADQFNSMTAQVQQGLIGAARISAKENHPDWMKYDQDIKRIMSQFDPWSQANVQMWETAYVHAKGQRYDADVDAATAAASRSSEPLAPAPPEPEPEIQLTAIQREIARGLEITEDRAKLGIKRYKTNSLLFTYDNVTVGRDNGGQ